MRDGGGGCAEDAVFVAAEVSVFFFIQNQQLSFRRLHIREKKRTPTHFP